jgi:hypothetical protein
MTERHKTRLEELLYTNTYPFSLFRPTTLWLAMHVIGQVRSIFFWLPKDYDHFPENVN